MDLRISFGVPILARWLMMQLNKTCSWQMVQSGNVATFWFRKVIKKSFKLLKDRRKSVYVLLIFPKWDTVQEHNVTKLFPGGFWTLYKTTKLLTWGKSILQPVCNALLLSRCSDVMTNFYTPLGLKRNSPIWTSLEIVSSSITSLNKSRKTFTR